MASASLLSASPDALTASNGTVALSTGELISSTPVTRESLGEHIIAEIARCSGPQLPCHKAEQIIDGFWDRFGARGMIICDQAFAVHGGIWRGAPVTVLRFQESHDQFFALPLLGEAQAGG